MVSSSANKVRIDIVADEKDAVASLGKVETAGRGMTDRLRQMRLPLLGVAGAVGGLGFASVKAASDIEESMNAVNVIFEGAADQVHAFSQGSAEAVGLATSDFNQLAATTGALLKDTGIPLNEVADLTTDLAVRAADMASVFNTDVNDALGAIQQALRGETEAIRRYAGDVTDATLEQFALAEGIEKSVREMDQQEKRLLRVGLIMSQTDKFAGDFANTSGSLANQTRIMSAEMTNLSAQMGAALLPAMSSVMGAMSGAIGFFANLDSGTQTLIVSVGALAGALAVIGLVIPPLVTAVGTLRLAFLALSANPLVVAITGLGLATGLLVDKFVSFGGPADDAIDKIDGIKTAASDSADSVNDLAGAMDNLTAATAGQGVASLAEIETALDRIVDRAGRVGALVSAGLTTPGDPLQAFAEDPGGFVETMGLIRSVTDRSVADIENLGIGVTDLEKAFSDAGMELANYPRLMQAAARSTDDVAEAERELAEAVNETATISEQAARAQGDMARDRVAYIRQIEQLQEFANGNNRERLARNVAATEASELRIQEAMQTTLDKIEQQRREREAAEEHHRRRYNEAWDASLKRQVESERAEAEERKRIAKELADEQVRQFNRVQSVYDVRRGRARLSERQSLRTALEQSLTGEEALKNLMALLEVRARVTAGRSGFGPGGAAAGAINISERIANLLGIEPGTLGLTVADAAGTQFAVGDKGLTLTDAELLSRLGNTIIVQGDLYGWDDFVDKVGAANAQIDWRNPTTGFE